MIKNEVLQNALETQHQFQQAGPFRHIAIDGFLEEPAARELLADFPAFDRRKAINELGEVGRKAVFENVSGISPAYKRFYEYINSKPFLEAMSQLTGIPDLLADPTLFGGGTHENLDGQALDVHIDFNIDERRMLHRRLNLLVYLNDEWDASWGGCIELHSNPRFPAANEVHSFLPIFNRAVLFETNEYSWHGFERICLPQDKKHLSRKSLSIYLYTKDRPAEEVVAPHTTMYVARPIPDDRFRVGQALSEEDVQAIRYAVASRDGLLSMYQKLLVEKEQRLRDFVTLKQSAIGQSPSLAYDIILSSRSWRLIVLLHRIKFRLLQGFRRLGFAR